MRISLSELLPPRIICRPNRKQVRELMPTQSLCFEGKKRHGFGRVRNRLVPGIDGLINPHNPGCPGIGISPVLPA